MTRQIKFRAWDGNRIYQWSELDGNEFTVEQLFTPDIPTWNLMQYTGLKDKNGKEIYEGDIVKVYFEGLSGYKEVFNAPIHWNSEYAKFELNQKRKVMGELSYQVLEVIGDIYSNPDLIKQ